MDHFFLTIFPITTRFFHGMADRLLAAAGGVFKGPHVSIQLPFREAESEGDFFRDVPLKFKSYDARQPAKADRAVTYAQGPLGPRTGPLTVGAFNPTTRNGKGDRMFRGLIDDIRVFGSTTDGAGALPLQQIQSIQRDK